jgi:hypothetical protein
MATMNGQFTTDTSGWAVDGTSTITRQTTPYLIAPASAVVVTDGTADHGATYSMSGDAAQNSTWDASCYVQQHGVGDNGRHVYLQIASVGGTGENAKSSDVVLAAGWQQATVTFQFANASHTAASVNVRQSGAGAAINVDLDVVQFARHLVYAAAGNPLNSGLWVPGVPAANFSEPNDTTTAQLIASGLYTGA